MRHLKARRRIQRYGAERRALLKSLVRALLQEQRITTTIVKAKAAQRVAEKLITLGKKDTVHARRQAFKVLGDRTAIKNLFSNIAPLFKDRNGGYTRVLHMGPRQGDAAPMALLELVEKTSGYSEKLEDRAQRAATKAKSAAHAHHDHAAEEPQESAKPAKSTKAKASKQSDAQTATQDDAQVKPSAAQGDKKNFVSNLKQFFKKKDKGKE